MDKAKKEVFDTKYEDLVSKYENLKPLLLTQEKEKIKSQMLRIIMDIQILTTDFVKDNPDCWLENFCEIRKEVKKKIMEIIKDCNF